MSRLSIEIPDTIHRQIKAQASLQGLSIREFVLRRLRMANDKTQAKPDKTFSASGLAGMWRDRDDLKDPEAWLRGVRKSRTVGEPADAD